MTHFADEATLAYIAELEGKLAALSQPAGEQESALQQYSRFMAQGDERSPVERLRFFLSLALNGQDWQDVEPFIADITAALSAARQRIEGLEGALHAIATHYTDTGLAAKHMSAIARAALSPTGDSVDYSPAIRQLKEKA